MNTQHLARMLLIYLTTSTSVNSVWIQDNRIDEDKPLYGSGDELLPLGFEDDEDRAANRLEKESPNVSGLSDILRFRDDLIWNAEREEEQWRTPAMIPTQGLIERHDTTSAKAGDVTRTDAELNERASTSARNGAPALDAFSAGGSRSTSIAGILNAERDKAMRDPLRQKSLQNSETVEGVASDDVTTEKRPQQRSRQNRSLRAVLEVMDAATALDAPRNQPEAERDARENASVLDMVDESDSAAVAEIQATPAEPSVSLDIDGNDGVAERNDGDLVKTPRLTDRDRQYLEKYRHKSQLNEQETPEGRQVNAGSSFDTGFISSSADQRATLEDIEADKAPPTIDVAVPVEQRTRSLRLEADGGRLLTTPPNRSLGGHATSLSAKSATNMPNLHADAGTQSRAPPLRGDDTTKTARKVRGPEPALEVENRVATEPNSGVTAGWRRERRVRGSGNTGEKATQEESRTAAEASQPHDSGAFTAAYDRQPTGGMSPTDQLTRQHVQTGLATPEETSQRSPEDRSSNSIVSFLQEATSIEQDTDSDEQRRLETNHGGADVHHVGVEAERRPVEDTATTPAGNADCSRLQINPGGMEIPDDSHHSRLYSVENGGSKDTTATLAPDADESRLQKNGGGVEVALDSDELQVNRGDVEVPPDSDQPQLPSSRGGVPFDYEEPRRQTAAVVVEETVPALTSDSARDTAPPSAAALTRHSCQQQCQTLLAGLRLQVAPPRLLVASGRNITLECRLPNRPHTLAQLAWTFRASRESSSRGCSLTPPPGRSHHTGLSADERVGRLKMCRGRSNAVRQSFSVNRTAAVSRLHIRRTTAQYIGHYSCEATVTCCVHLPRPTQAKKAIATYIQVYGRRRGPGWPVAVAAAVCLLAGVLAALGIRGRCCHKTRFFSPGRGHYQPVKVLSAAYAQPPQGVEADVPPTPRRRTQEEQDELIDQLIDADATRRRERLAAEQLRRQRLQLADQLELAYVHEQQRRRGRQLPAQPPVGATADFRVVHSDLLLQRQQQQQQQQQQQADATRSCLELARLPETSIGRTHQQRSPPTPRWEIPLTPVAEAPRDATREQTGTGF